MSKLISLLSISILLVTCSLEKGIELLVSDMDELNTAIKTAQPDDKIV